MNFNDSANLTGDKSFFIRLKIVEKNLLVEPDSKLEDQVFEIGSKPVSRYHLVSIGF